MNRMDSGIKEVSKGLLSSLYGESMDLARARSNHQTLDYL